MSVEEIDAERQRKRSKWVDLTEVTIMHNKGRGKEGTGGEAKEKERIGSGEKGESGKWQKEKERKKILFTLK